MEGQRRILPGSARAPPSLPLHRHGYGILNPLKKKAVNLTAPDQPPQTQKSRHSRLLGTDRYQTPLAIPINLLGRLAVDVHHQHQGLGSALVKFALETTIEMSRFTGVYALVVQPLNESVINFYRGLGFKFNQTEKILYMPTRDKQGNFLTL